MLTKICFWVNSFYFHFIVNNPILLPSHAWKWSIFFIQNVIYVFVLHVQPIQSFSLDMVELILNLINDKIIVNLRTVKLRMLTNSIKSFLTFIQMLDMKDMLFLSYKLKEWSLNYLLHLPIRRHLLVCLLPKLFFLSFCSMGPGISSVWGNVDPRFVIHFCS